MFPVWATYACQSLPRCERRYRLRVLRTDPTPEGLRLSYLVFRFGLPASRVVDIFPMHTQTGTLRASQVLVRFSPGMPRSSRTPADPQRTHLVVLSVLASGPLRPSPSALAITGLYQASGSAVFPVAYLIPCVCFKCVVRFADTRGLCPFFSRVGVAGISFPTPRFSLRGGHFSNRTSTSFTLATLGTSDGLGLTRQRLALCKKRQALLGAPTVGFTRVAAG